MNKLSTEERARVVACLVEGNSIRATCRMTGAAKNTVAKLLVDLGRACTEYQDKAFRNLKCKRIQCDEIWSFCGAKEKNASREQKKQGWGSVWTWTALDSDTKLIPCWFVGDRGATSAYHFMHDLAERLAHRVQLTTDGHAVYLGAVEMPSAPTLIMGCSLRFMAHPKRKINRRKSGILRLNAWVPAKRSSPGTRTSATFQQVILKGKTSLRSRGWGWS